MSKESPPRSERWFGVRPSERLVAFGAFSTLLGITAAHTLLETARDAIFLARLPATQLPWMYLSVALFGILLAEIDRRVGARAQHQIGVTGILLAGSLVTGSFALVSRAGAAGLYAMYVWTALFASWATLQFSLVLSSAFTVEQAKRIFGFIGAGSILGAVVGGALARGLLVVLPPSAMVVGAATLFAITGAGPARVVSKGVRASVSTPATSSLSGGGAVFKHPYGRLLFALLLSSSLALTFSDYIFKSQVRAAMPAESLAPFFASVQLVFSAVSLTIQLFAVPVILRMVGAHGAMLLLPVLLSLGAVGLQAGAGIVGAVLLRGADGSLRYSVHRTGIDVLYMPLSDGERRRLKPALDAFGQRGGQALAAVLLLGVAALPLSVSVLILVSASLFWVGAIAALRSPYVELFRASLERGFVGTPSELPRLDLPALESAVVALNSTSDREVSLALDLLATHRDGKLVPALILYHPSSLVVLHALDVFARLERPDILPILDRLLVHADPSIRAAALRCRSQIAPDESLLRKFLEEPCPETSSTALVGLVTHGWMDEREAKSRLDHLVEGASSDLFMGLARAVEAQPDSRANSILLACTQSHDPAVRDATARAMAKMPHAVFIPSLVNMLERHGSRETARKALVSIGASALDALDRILADQSSAHVVRRHIPESIRRFDPHDAADRLVRHLVNENDGMVRFKLIRSLNRLHVEHPEIVIDPAVVESQIAKAISSSFKLIDLRVSLVRGASDDASRATPAQTLLVDVLHDKEIHALERIVRLVNLMLPGQDLRSVIRALTGGRARARASAIEVLEAVVPSKFREPVLALCRDIPDEARLSFGKAFHAPLSLDYEATLLSLVSQGGNTLRALAAYHAAELEIDLPEHVPMSLRAGRRSSAVDELLRAVELAPVSRRPAFQGV